MLSRFSAFTLVASTLFLSSCAAMVDDSYQDFTIKTPGAENAFCFVYIDKIKYQAYPPQTINIMKSENKMRIDCKAPGNRDKEIFVKPIFSARAIWGGPPGMAWDYASKALFHYPNMVEVDFTDVPVEPFAQPKHNSKDIAQPEEHQLDEISPAQPILNEDRNQKELPIRRRDDVEFEESLGELPSQEAVQRADKGHLMSVIDQLQEVPEPQAGDVSDVPAPAPIQAPVEAAPSDLHDLGPAPVEVPALSEPIPLYPGQ